MIPAVVKDVRWIILVAVVAALTPLTPLTASETAGPEAKTPPYSNRLIHSRNPYLLLHADNPVDWFSWGPEPFEKARLEDKPIFVSIGYSTCYWCHVAERTIYSNPEIAALMNRWFVNVKVDREQRPDVDRVYLLATQILTGRGGWPNNVFLTPDRKPFFAGSYFPPEDDPKLGAGFPTILATIHDAWVNERQTVDAAAEEIATALRNAQSEGSLWTATPVDPDALLRRARNSLLGQLDYRWGGFLDPVSEAKFPRVPQLAMLLLDYRLHQSSESLAAVTRTLDSMSDGGIHDHLAGGFHRYSLDASWSIPHFEKMLYDNAQLLRLYAGVFEVTGNSLYRKMAIETGTYLGGEMMSAEGGFYTAQDAQVNGIEGASYLWTSGQIADALGDEAAGRFLKAYRVAPLPHSAVPDVPRPPERAGEQPGVLRIRHPLKQAALPLGLENSSQVLEAFSDERDKLLAVRNQRAQPARDEKIIVSQNGLTILALAESSIVLDEPRFLRWAERAAERIWRLAYHPQSGMLYREIFQNAAQTEGFLEDYALLGQSMFALARATGNARWRERAVRLSQDLIDRFLRGDGSLSTTQYEAGLLVPVPVQRDVDMPSPTSAALEFLLQANAVVRDAAHARAANRAASRMSARIQASPEQWSSAVAAFNLYPPPQTVAASAVGDSAVGEGALPSTAGHVRVAAVPRSEAGAERVIVTLEVDEGYHVNANPASFDYLIPTSLSFEGIEPRHVRYPDPDRFTPAFAPDGLDVYQGTVTLVATFPKGALEEKPMLSGRVTAQACTDEICLPPSAVPFSVDTADLRGSP